MADAICIRTARFATPTSVNGNTDWTTADLGGLTPKAVMIIANHADTDGTVETGLIFGLGFADATREASTSNANQSAVASSNSKCTSEAAVISIDDWGGTAIAIASFVSFITNGVRLNFTVVDTDALLFTVVFFAGDDLSVYADAPSISSGANDITAPGFQPDLLLATCNWNAADAAHMITGFGAATSSAQRSVGIGSRDDQSTSQENTILGTTDIVTALFNDAVFFQMTISAFDANGFTVTKSGHAAAKEFAYLALNFGGSASAWVGSMDTPTATGDDAQTGPSFKPQFVMLGMTDCQAENVLEADADAGSFGIVTFDKDGNEFSNSWASEEGVTTTNTQSLSDNQAVNFHTGAGVAQHAATFSAMDATGFTLNYSVADGTTRKWLGVAIEEVAAGGGVGQPTMRRWGGVPGMGMNTPSWG